MAASTATTMPETLTPLAGIDKDIAEAWLELLDARQDLDHSPNADSQRAAVYAEARVNRLLERRYAAR